MLGRHGRRASRPHRLQPHAVHAMLASTRSSEAMSSLPTGHRLRRREPRVEPVDAVPPPHHEHLSYGRHHCAAARTSPERDAQPPGHPAIFKRPRLRLISSYDGWRREERHSETEYPAFASPPPGLAGRRPRSHPRAAWTEGSACGRYGTLLGVSAKQPKESLPKLDLVIGLCTVANVDVHLGRAACS